uniref:Uncharacterized protein n=1 Tax=Anopheles quadriannulatus TaxID=34691 RepID=A0A182XTD0_ANOQN
LVSSSRYWPSRTRTRLVSIVPYRPTGAFNCSLEIWMECMMEQLRFTR